MSPCWEASREVLRATSGRTSETTQHPYSVYDFTASRSRAGPTRFLAGYSGYLHADAYTGYDAMFLDVASGVSEVACWSHARRKFFDAVPGYPRQAHQVLEWIRQLYDIEDRAHDLSVDARHALRLAESSPILDRIEVYLAELARSVLPKSNLAKAVTYARNQWEALRRYTEDGRSDDRQQRQRANASAPSRGPEELALSGQ